MDSTLASTRLLHVANGSCTTRLIEAAGIPGLLSLWADPLHDGPVPGGLGDDELLAVRRRHLGDPASPASADPRNDLRRWREVIAAHDGYDELVLWFEHDLFDQLNLIQVLGWIRGRVPAGKVVTQVDIAEHVARSDFKGLGELAPRQIAAAFAGRQPVGAAQFELAAAAWRAFREPSPQALADFRQRDLTALPFLEPALTRLLQELPWTSDGLSRSERRLLQLVQAGAEDLASALPRMHDDERAFYVTDTGLEDLRRELSESSPPLLATDGARLRLSDAGRAVLNGDADRVEMCGLDRWIGGAHLHIGNMWRWDDARQSVTRTA